MLRCSELLKDFQSQDTVLSTYVIVLMDLHLLLLENFEALQNCGSSTMGIYGCSL